MTTQTNAREVRLFSADDALAIMDQIDAGKTPQQAIAAHDAKLTDGAKVDYLDGDDCPKHGTPPRKSYTFGMMDAEVYTFQGCGCAVCHEFDMPCDYLPSYWTSYGKAAGCAELRKQTNAAM